VFVRGQGSNGDVGLEDGEWEDRKAAGVAVHEGDGERPRAGDREVETESESAVEGGEGSDDAGGWGGEVGEVAGERGLGGHCGGLVCVDSDCEEVIALALGACCYLCAIV